MLSGVVGEAGWFFRRSTAVGVEIAFPFQRNALTQRVGYFLPYVRDSRYREQTVFVVLRGVVQATDRVRLALVGGGGFARGSSLDRYAQGRFGSSVFGPFGDEREERHTAMGMTVGTDLAINAGRAMSVVPQFRLLIVDRGGVRDSEPSFADLGLPTVIYRVGIGVRAAF